MSHPRAWFSALLLTLLPALVSAQLPAYTFHRLGPPGVRAIDPLSQTAVGTATLDGVPRAVILNGGMPQPLANTPAVFSEAFGIYGARIVGWYEASPGIFHAFLWTEAHGLRDLGTLGGAQSFSQATAVNRGGDVVGYASQAATNSLQAVLWRQGRAPEPLPTLPNYPGSLASQITTEGIIAGVIVGPRSETRFQHTVLWDAAGQVHDLHDVSLGRSSIVEGLNTHGVAVGTLQRQGTETEGPNARAFVASPTQPMTLLPPLPGDDNSFAGGINDAGLIAGISSLANPPEGESLRSTAVLWVGGQPIDVVTLATNPAGWSHFTDVKGISEAGHLVGEASFEGQRRSFLAVAGPPPPAPGSPEDKERRGRGRDRHQPRVPPQNPREHPVGR